MQAEAAEVDADRALGEARMRVRAAKDHVWRLEEEAKEEARRAKIKQEQAREVSKRGQGLGRKFPSLQWLCCVACLLTINCCRSWLVKKQIRYHCCTMLLIHLHNVTIPYRLAVRMRGVG